jgi:RNA polymerase sigma-70 factor (ECF subfamily)
LSSDEDLMGRFQKGDRASFDILWSRFDRPLLAFALGIVQDWHAAEDVVQQTGCKLFLNAARTWRPNSGAFRTYLFQIVRNSTIDYLRKHKGDPATLCKVRMEDFDEALEAAWALGRHPPRTCPAFAPAVLHPSGRPATPECIEALRVCLGRLDDEPRAVVLGYYVEGLVHRELAEKLDCSISSIRALRMKAEKSLRTCMKAKGYENLEDIGL